jgi:hypothetical protein
LFLPLLLAVAAAPGYLYAARTAPLRGHLNKRRRWWVRLSLWLALTISLVGTVTSFMCMVPFLAPLPLLAGAACVRLIREFEQGPEESEPVFQSWRRKRLLFNLAIASGCAAGCMGYLMFHGRTPRSSLDDFGVLFAVGSAAAVVAWANVFYTAGALLESFVPDGIRRSLRAVAWSLALASCIAIGVILAVSATTPSSRISVVTDCE